MWSRSVQFPSSFMRLHRHQIYRFMMILALFHALALLWYYTLWLPYYYKPTVSEATLFKRCSAQLWSLVPPTVKVENHSQFFYYVTLPTGGISLHNSSQHLRACMKLLQIQPSISSTAAEAASSSSSSQSAAAAAVIKPHCFAQSFANADIPLLRRNLLIFRDAFIDNDIELMLDFGSVIGSWRHHSVIPYDDDIDFRIKHTDKARVRTMLESMANDSSFGWVFADTERVNQHWKLGIECPPNVTLYGCRWQIDIFFHWPCPRYHSMCFLERPRLRHIRTIYPLTIRPLVGLLFHTVNDFASFFKGTYKTSDTVCSYFSRLAKNPCSEPRLPCALLHDRYPYVLRWRQAGTTAAAAGAHSRPAPFVELLVEEKNATVHLKAFFIGSKEKFI